MNPSFSNLQPTFISIHLKSLNRIVYTQVSGNLITCPYSSHCLAATPGYFTATLKLPTSPPISYSQLMTCLLISLKKIEAVTPELPYLPALSDNLHPPSLLLQWLSPPFSQYALWH